MRRAAGGKETEGRSSGRAPSQGLSKGNCECKLNSSFYCKIKDLRINDNNNRASPHTSLAPGDLKRSRRGGIDHRCLSAFFSQVPTSSFPCTQRDADDIIPIASHSRLFFYLRFFLSPSPSPSLSPTSTWIYFHPIQSSCHPKSHFSFNTLFFCSFPPCIAFSGTPIRPCNPPLPRSSGCLSLFAWPAIFLLACPLSNDPLALCIKAWKESCCVYSLSCHRALLLIYQHVKPVSISCRLGVYSFPPGTFLMACPTVTASAQHGAPFGIR